MHALKDGTVLTNYFAAFSGWTFSNIDIFVASFLSGFDHLTLVEGFYGICGNVFIVVSKGLILIF